MWGEHGKGPWGWPARGQSVDWKQIPRARSEGGLRNWRCVSWGQGGGLAQTYTRGSTGPDSHGGSWPRALKLGENGRI